MVEELEEVIRCCLEGRKGSSWAQTTEPWLTVSSFPRPRTSGKPELQARNWMDRHQLLAKCTAHQSLEVGNTVALVSSSKGSGEAGQESCHFQPLGSPLLFLPDVRALRRNYKGRSLHPVFSWSPTAPSSAICFWGSLSLTGGALKLQPANTILFAREPSPKSERQLVPQPWMYKKWEGH